MEQPSLHEAGLKPLRILLTYDHEINRRFMIELLTRHGHQVDTVGTGIELLAALPRRVYDLVLTDITMPEEMPVFDRQYQQCHFKGDSDFLQELPDIYLEELPDKLRQIEDSVATGIFGWWKG